jgi:hypothetical protein
MYQNLRLIALQPHRQHGSLSLRVSTRENPNYKEPCMPLTISKEVTSLERLTVPQLRERYAAAFGEATNAGNKQWLIKRIAWRLQALAEGDLSERARQRATELACDADLRLSPPKQRHAIPASHGHETVTLSAPPVDDRLPPPGTILTRPYKGRTVQVQVQPQGFAYEGQTYPSLSAVAKAITGSHCNGYHFFRLTGERGVA